MHAQTLSETLRGLAYARVFEKQAFCVLVSYSRGVRFAVAMFELVTQRQAMSNSPGKVGIRLTYPLSGRVVEVCFLAVVRTVFLSDVAPAKAVQEPTATASI